MSEKKYESFAEFYPFYLSEHKNNTCRMLHFVGSFLILVLIFYCVLTSHYILLFLVPFIGYGFAWVGHFFYEHNRPATFTYPFYSFWADWVMFKDILLGKLTFSGDQQ